MKSDLQSKDKITIKPIISLTEVTKNFTSGDEIIKAVDNISLMIKQYEFIVIMGPSGSGKSTLLNVIAGLSNLTKGDIIINEKPFHNLSENQKAKFRRNEIGIIFQFYNLHEGLTAIENIELPMLIASIPLKERRKRSMALLKEVDMEHRAYHRPHELSGGEKQRIGIARALANNASILLADEPTGDLDYENGRKILDLLVKINKERKVTVIMVTHDSSLIQNGFRLIRLNDGCITFDEIINDAESIIDDFSALVK
ncbi:MAG: ABC transporter ATP-binding protein [Candidatus Hodarchaeales archaeon]|jgi:putative ABC transport system ATP-binding protein